jgi:NADH-quinone oxidoreductase subunit F
MTVRQSFVVLRHRECDGISDLERYVESGGYVALRRAVEEYSPSQVVDIVKASGLRGRGGAGFSTGVKWSFIPPDRFPRYVAVNADESEPGTFKDREIIEANPHQLLEGAAICAYAIQASVVYIYCRGEFWLQMRRLDEAIAAARQAGYLGSNVLGSDFTVEIYTTPGAGAYICGEETAMLNSMEGLLGQPRVRPPFPAVEGLYGQPTVINNVETLANVPPIIANGADWYRAIGTEKSPGTKVFCVSGHVQRPGNYELPLGSRVLDLLELAGGVWHGRSLKAILPAGASAPLLPAAMCADLTLDWEAVQAAGSMLGSASLIVMDETCDMVWVADKTTRFFAHESCGKCTPCREGTYWLKQVYGQIMRGEGDVSDVRLLRDVAESINGKCLCPLGEFALSSVYSTLEFYAQEYERVLGSKSGARA